MNKLVALAVGAGVGWLLTSGQSRRCGDGELQAYLRTLDDDIRLGRFEENASLREKRDLLISELRDTLPSALTWAAFGQGSYALGTGVRPQNKDYDIDVGIVFDRINLDKTDPVSLKETVFSALCRGNRRIEMRRPCVTIYYLRDGAVDYHVDLAVYAKRPSDGVLCLALGRQHSAKELRIWSAQDPQGLIDTVKARFSGEGAKQFCRCVRYLKAWRNTQFKQGGAPTSIALTSAALRWFEPVYFDFWEDRPDDARALARLVLTIHEKLVSKPQIELPVTPRCNLLERMTTKQLKTFLFKLQELHSTIQSAIGLPSDQLPHAHLLIDGAFGRGLSEPQSY